ncbi:hypothetical protein GCM10023307_19160 [Lysobacter hankyongensis]|uniref:Uncharacterized protein n=1 Tax=Lysobacter hankyongensis TaxID=1176535 RepID=A0ABP9BEJ2_9GAMM
MLAFGAATSAHAQSKGSGDRVELPVWNKSSGAIEAIVVLEPADVAKSRTLARFGVRHLDSTFGLNAGDSLGLLCDRKHGLSSALNNLADNCVLASIPARRTGATAIFQRNGTQVGVGAGSSRTPIPAWLAPGTGGNGRVDLNDITIFSQKALPREGYVSIAGTVAKARLQSPSEIPGFSDRWTSRQLNVGGGIGDFGVNVIGEVVDTPGRDRWGSLGLGLSWRTPWSGQLTVGADNLVTRGKNPFAPASDEGDDEGAVPYVRYEQDL